jgi:hypothetical protein
MDAKWPFMLIVFGLLFALGLIISTLERSSVMKNWDKRRCELPVTIASMFFKPDSDPRSKSDFAKDNFNFCMGQYVDNFMKILLTPINAVFGKHTNLAGSAIDMISTIRNLATTLMNTLSEFLDTYYRKFNASVYEISRIIQYLRMAMRRANGVVINMLYTGLTMFRGLLSTIQFVIKVILIICGIMLAIIIILIFVLFPFIPMILSVLGAIVSTVLILAMYVSNTIGNEASSDSSGFCFSEKTYIIVNENGKNIKKSVNEIKIGDKLGNNYGKITAIIKMNGKNIQLYDINGIIVSGSHLILGTDNIWKSVASDERSIKVNDTSNILYCFNTTTHNIPVYSDKLNSIITFRDWEEIPDDDEFGQYTWVYTILSTLNNNSNYLKWNKGLKVSSEVPLMGIAVNVKTKRGFIELSKLSMNDKILDREGKEQEILGVIYGEIENVEYNNDKWNTELYELKDNIWIKGHSNIKNGKENVCGITLITETGEIIIWDEIEKKEKIVRDFTEIGYKEIHKTYPLVASRLRLLNPLTRLSKV